MTTTVTAYVGSLPADHPYMVRLIRATRATASKAEELPMYEQHPIMGAYLDAARALASLGDSADTVWVSWVDALPPGGPDLSIQNGHLLCAAYFQVGGSAVRTGYDMRATSGDPQPGDFHAGMYKTARRKRLSLNDGMILDVPVWRLHRPDRPHKTVCVDACADCGTGDYWNLAQFTWPEPSIGLSAPENPSRLDAGEKTLWALGAKPGKVVLTDRALFEHGSQGVPAQRRTGRIIHWRETDTEDILVVKWNGRNGGESVVRPNQVQRPEPLAD